MCADFWLLCSGMCLSDLTRHAKASLFVWTAGRVLPVFFLSSIYFTQIFVLAFGYFSAEWWLGLTAKNMISANAFLTCEQYHRTCKAILFLIEFLSNLGWMFLSAIPKCAKHIIVWIGFWIVKRINPDHDAGLDLWRWLSSPYPNSEFRCSRLEEGSTIGPSKISGSQREKRFYIVFWKTLGTVVD